MDYGLQTTFNAAVGLVLLREVAARGFTMARIDLQETTDPDVRAELIAEVMAVGLRPLVIIRDAGQMEGLFDWIDIELRNEPDGPVGGTMTPAAYAALVQPFLEACAIIDAQPWIGSISNLDRDSLDWLDAMLIEARLVLGESPSHVGISVHRYPHGRTWHTPHHGFRSRSDEVSRLQQIIGRRRWMVSEFGYHTAPQRRTKRLPIWFPWNSWRWTEAEVSVNVAYEWAFWEGQGASAAVLYQLARGQNPREKEDAFGIYDPETQRWFPHARSVLIHQTEAA